MLLYRTNLLLHRTLRSQTLAHIIEIFQNTHHIDTFHVAASRVLLAHLTPALYTAEAYSEHLQTSKMEFLCAFS